MSEFFERPTESAAQQSDCTTSPPPRHTIPQPSSTMATPQPKPVTLEKPAAKKETVKGTSQPWTVQQSYTWAQAGLCYESKATIGTWTPLEPAPGQEGYPVSIMVDGNIVISQVNKEATCTCKLQKDIGFSFVGGSHAGVYDVTISLAVLKAPEFNFGGQQPELAKQFPLAKTLVSVNGLQLKNDANEKYTTTGKSRRVRANTVKQIIDHIRVILTRKDTLDVKHPPHLPLNEDKSTETSLPELPEPEPSAAEKLADWEGRVAMAMYEKEEEAATRLEAFEQDLARRREAFEQDAARARDTLKAQLDAEKKELEEELETEKESLEKKLLERRESLEKELLEIELAMARPR